MSKSIRTCSIDGCDKPHKARGLCAGHYRQQWRGQKLQPLRPAAARDRFLSKINKNAPGGCWEWTGATNNKGYGQIRVDGRSMLVHRFSWELVNSPIPRGMDIDHRCANRRCANPEHLRVVTRSQNNQHRLIARTDNTSGVRGVTWCKRSKAWKARAQVNGRSYSGGYHSTLEAADAAARALRAQLFTHDDHDEWLNRTA